MAKGSNKQSHQLRIIAGQWRGQKIQLIDQQDLRPSTDRVRETVFNWLALPIVNARCLDAFAGSAILSFEALSRQAASIVAVEKSAAACRAIRKNALHLDAQNFQLIEQSIEPYLNSLNGSSEQFDVIFLDPPFAQPQLMISVLNLIFRQKLLVEDGLLYIEMAAHDFHCLDECEYQLSWLKKKTAGQVCYALARKS